MICNQVFTASINSVLYQNESLPIGVEYLTKIKLITEHESRMYAYKLFEGAVLNSVKDTTITVSNDNIHDLKLLMNGINKYFEGHKDYVEPQGIANAIEYSLKNDNMVTESGGSFQMVFSQNTIFNIIRRCILGGIYNNNIDYKIVT